MSIRTHRLFDSTFCGVIIYQYWADLVLWELLLNEQPNIKTIVELGTGKGGHSLFLKAQCIARGLRFRTMDRSEPVALGGPLAHVLSLSEDFVKADFWTSLDLVHWLQDESWKPLLLYVDGGSKRREFAGFVPLLSPGDYVAVHDYSTEFLPCDALPVTAMIEPLLERETEGQPKPCLTRFWKVV